MSFFFLNARVQISWDRVCARAACKGERAGKLTFLAPIEIAAVFMGVLVRL